MTETEHLWYYFSSGSPAVSYGMLLRRAVQRGVYFTRNEMDCIFEGRASITEREFRMWYENAELLS